MDAEGYMVDVHLQALLLGGGGIRACPLRPLQGAVSALRPRQLLRKTGGLLDRLPIGQLRLPGARQQGGAVLVALLQLRAKLRPRL
eukprot:1189811-Prorocentrum_minimum.AAC.2